MKLQTLLFWNKAFFKKHPYYFSTFPPFCEAVVKIEKSPKKVPSCIFFEKKKYAKMTLWAIWPDQ